MVFLCCLDVALFSIMRTHGCLCEQEESAGFLSLTRVMSLDKYVSFLLLDLFSSFGKCFLFSL